MKTASLITTLFLDIGGVLLTNGWDHHARKRATTSFKLDLEEMEDRHHLTFGAYEKGKLTGFASSSWTGSWTSLAPPASSTSASPTRTSFGLRWTSPRRQHSR